MVDGVAIEETDWWSNGHARLRSPVVTAVRVVRVGGRWAEVKAGSATVYSTTQRLSTNK